GPVRLVVEPGDKSNWYWIGGRVLRQVSGDPSSECEWPASWTPVGAVDWLTPGPGLLEVALVDVGGDVHWAEVDAREPERRGVRGSLLPRRARVLRGVYFPACGAEGSRHRRTSSPPSGSRTVMGEVVPDRSPTAGNLCDSGAGTTFPARRDWRFARTTQHRPC